MDDATLKAFEEAVNSVDGKLRDGNGNVVGGGSQEIAAIRERAEADLRTAERREVFQERAGEIADTAGDMFATAANTFAMSGLPPLNAMFYGTFDAGKAAAENIFHGGRTPLLEGYGERMRESQDFFDNAQSNLTGLQNFLSTTAGVMPGTIVHAPVGLAQLGAAGAQRTVRMLSSGRRVTTQPVTRNTKAERPDWFTRNVLGVPEEIGMVLDKTNIAQNLDDILMSQMVTHTGARGAGQRIMAAGAGGATAAALEHALNLTPEGYLPAAGDVLTAGGYGMGMQATVGNLMAPALRRLLSNSGDMALVEGLRDKLEQAPDVGMSLDNLRRAAQALDPSNQETLANLDVPKTSPIRAAIRLHDVLALPAGTTPAGSAQYSPSVVGQRMAANNGNAIFLQSMKDFYDEADRLFLQNFDDVPSRSQLHDGLGLGSKEWQQTYANLHDASTEVGGRSLIVPQKSTTDWHKEFRDSYYLSMGGRDINNILPDGTDSSRVAGPRAALDAWDIFTDGLRVMTPTEVTQTSRMARATGRPHESADMFIPSDLTIAEIMNARRELSDSTKGSFSDTYTPTDQRARVELLRQIDEFLAGQTGGASAEARNAFAKSMRMQDTADRFYNLYSSPTLDPSVHTQDIRQANPRDSMLELYRSIESPQEQEAARQGLKAAIRQEYKTFGRAHTRQRLLGPERFTPEGNIVYDERPELTAEWREILGDEFVDDIIASRPVAQLGELHESIAKMFRDRANQGEAYTPELRGVVNDYAKDNATFLQRLPILGAYMSTPGKMRAPHLATHYGDLLSRPTETQRNRITRAVDAVQMEPFQFGARTGSAITQPGSADNAANNAELVDYLSRAAAAFSERNQQGLEAEARHRKEDEAYEDFLRTFE